VVDRFDQLADGLEQGFDDPAPRMPGRERRGDGLSQRHHRDAIERDCLLDRRSAEHERIASRAGRLDPHRFVS
jgi:hypothetical protein